MSGPCRRKSRSFCNAHVTRMDVSLVDLLPPRVQTPHTKNAGKLYFDVCPAHNFKGNRSGTRSDCDTAVSVPVPEADAPKTTPSERRSMVRRYVMSRDFRSSDPS